MTQTSEIELTNQDETLKLAAIAVSDVLESLEVPNHHIEKKQEAGEGNWTDFFISFES